MRIAITSNGPGEFAGWVRPLLRALYAAEPQVDVTLFLVPDEYATGREAEVAAAVFPRLRVVTPRRYVRFALGRRAGDDLPPSVDLVQYLGGDLMHAARVHRRLGGRAQAYKFSRRRYRDVFDRVYAVDAPNRAQLERWGVPPERIEVVGNLAVDGAAAEAAGAFAHASAPRRQKDPIGDGGVVIMPGTRRREVSNLVPFFLTAAVWLRRFAPEVPIAFAISPFTRDDDLRDALRRGGDPRFWGTRGRLEADSIVAEQSAERFPIVRDAMQYAARAALAVAIPGTKCIELASLGVATLVCAPFNAPELVVVNGPLTYLDRIPALGAVLKRSVVMRFARRHRFLAQPNIDAGAALMPELRGALMPARVARVAAEYLDDVEGRAHAATALRELYRSHVGASERMARAMLRTA